MLVAPTLDLRNYPFRLGDGLACVRPKVEEERKKRDRLPDGRRVGLIAAHEGRPQQVSPLWKVADNAAHRLNPVPPAEIVRGILLLRFPSPLEPAD